MVDHETRLRPARPDHDEGLLFARYLDQAADGFFGLLLGRDAPDIIATVFPQAGHSLSGSMSSSPSANVRSSA